MDYKQKYEEALKNINKIKTANKDSKELVDFIEFEYPELKDSKDERIRKELIEYLKRRLRTSFNQEVRICKDGIAYLEKQGEQNPTNKFEPKFKAGDYIVNKYGFIMQIDDIDNNTYIYHVLDNTNTKLTYDITKTDKSCHLWTIQDAKNGDVLVTVNGGICIFNGTVEEGKYPFAYCGLTRYGFESYNRKLPFTHDGVYPATKEQRDLLFQKMKEAGYEWDDKKKELKKIKQISNWNEEDEKGLGDTLWAIKQARTIAKDENDMGNLWYAENWLKSIKERIKEE